MFYRVSKMARARGGGRHKLWPRGSGHSCRYWEAVYRYVFKIFLQCNLISISEAGDISYRKLFNSANFCVSAVNVMLYYSPEHGGGGFVDIVSPLFCVPYKEIDTSASPPTQFPLFFCPLHQSIFPTDPDNNFGLQNFIQNVCFTQRRREWWYYPFPPFLCHPHPNKSQLFADI